MLGIQDLLDNANLDDPAQTPAFVMARYSPSPFPSAPICCCSEANLTIKQHTTNRDEPAAYKERIREEAQKYAT